MKLKLTYIVAISIAVLALSNCVTTETTVTAPDGTVTRTKQTVVSGADIATGAIGTATAVGIVDNDK